MTDDETRGIVDMTSTRSAWFGDVCAGPALLLTEWIPIVNTRGPRPNPLTQLRQYPAQIPRSSCSSTKS